MREDVAILRALSNCVFCIPNSAVKFEASPAEVDATKADKEDVAASSDVENCPCTIASKDDVAISSFGIVT